MCCEHGCLHIVPMVSELSSFPQQRLTKEPSSCVRRLILLQNWLLYAHTLAAKDQAQHHIARHFLSRHLLMVAFRRVKLIVSCCPLLGSTHPHAQHTTLSKDTDRAWGPIHLHSSHGFDEGQWQGARQGQGILGALGVCRRRALQVQKLLRQLLGADLWVGFSNARGLARWLGKLHAALCPDCMRAGEVDLLAVVPGSSSLESPAELHALQLSGATQLYTADSAGKGYHAGQYLPAGSGNAWADQLDFPQTSNKAQSCAFGDRLSLLCTAGRSGRELWGSLQLPLGSHLRAHCSAIR